MISKFFWIKCAKCGIEILALECHIDHAHIFSLQQGSHDFIRVDCQGDNRLILITCEHAVLDRRIMLVRLQA